MDIRIEQRIDIALDLKKGFSFYALDLEQQEKLVTMFNASVNDGKYQEYHKMLSAHVCLLLDGLLSGELLADEFENAMLNTIEFLITLYK
jgi:hypothetical protein